MDFVNKYTDMAKSTLETYMGVEKSLLEICMDLLMYIQTQFQMLYDQMVVMTNDINISYLWDIVKTSIYSINMDDWIMYVKECSSCMVVKMIETLFRFTYELIVLGVFYVVFKMYRYINKPVEPVENSTVPWQYSLSRSDQERVIRTRRGYPTMQCNARGCLNVASRGLKRSTTVPLACMEHARPEYVKSFGCSLLECNSRVSKGTVYCTVHQ